MDVNAQIQQQTQKRLTALVRKQNADKRVAELADEMERHQADADRAAKDVEQAEAAIEALRPLMEDDSNGG